MMPRIRMLVVCALAVARAPLAAQVPAPAASPPSRAAIIAAARDIIQSATYGTLGTVGLDGHPQARIVDPFAPDSAFTIWIATNPRTRKVAEIMREPRVTRLYFNAAAFEYVTVIGRAVVDTSSREKAAHWKPSWKTHYADENRGADYQLLRVTPSRLEVVSVRRQIVNDTVTWRPVSVALPE